MDDKRMLRFDQLRRRFGGVNLLDREREDELTRVIAYLRSQGAHVEKGADIYTGVLSLNNEEELSSYRCVEGVAISHGSEGWWLLVRYDEALPLRDAAGVNIAVLTDGDTC